MTLSTSGDIRHRNSRQDTRTTSEGERDRRRGKESVRQEVSDIPTVGGKVWNQPILGGVWVCELDSVVRGRHIPFTTDHVLSFLALVGL